ncbi:MAG: hypothetical protein FJZ87_06060 [Chloroflexi bacterium]|nr:hypothetical protein [Chloroflexota bacterium]
MHLTDDQLNEYLDDALPKRARAESHLSTCAECTARLSALRSLAAEIESLPEESLARNLAPAVTRRLTSPAAAYSGFPRWLTLTTVLQTAAATVLIASVAPFILEAASTFIPALQAPPVMETILEAQRVWTAWLDALSQFQWPSPPELPASLGLSNFYILLALAGTALAWLVGNGLLLRSQIKQ